MSHWLSVAISTYVLHPLTGRGYQWWSGAGSDFGELTIFTGLVLLVRHQNCHVKGCWRMGGHVVADTPYKVCRKHHPDVPKVVTAEHVTAASRGRG